MRAKAGRAEAKLSRDDSGTVGGRLSQHETCWSTPVLVIERARRPKISGRCIPIATSGKPGVLSVTSAVGVARVLRVTRFAIVA